MKKIKPSDSFFAFANFPQRNIMHSSPMRKEGIKMKLDIRAFGLALGILWGASLIFFGLLAMAAPDYCSDFVRAIGSKYIGYAASFSGSIIGGIWGFIDAGIGGLILAWLYNKLARQN
jgi:hypothetical protein